MRVTLLSTVALAATLLFFASCGGSAVKTPDVSGIKAELKTARFDIDFYSMDTAHMARSLSDLHARYPDFLDYYLDTFMALGINRQYADTGAAIRRIDTLLTFKDFANLEDTIRKHYPDSRETDEVLLTAFKTARYYIPSFRIPRILYINSGLSNWPCFPLDSNTLCIGLDWFLGRQFPYYTSVGAERYMLSHMEKTYLPVSVLSALYREVHPFQTGDKTLLDMMIQRGKEQYFLHRTLPTTPDSVLFGFSSDQLSWCAANEESIYNYFIRQKLLYSKDPYSTVSYVNDGPYAYGLESPADPEKHSPGNIGTWLGYRIVCSYMNRHQQTTLPQLLSGNEDAAHFLDEAGYHPR